MFRCSVHPFSKMPCMCRLSVFWGTHTTKSVWGVLCCIVLCVRVFGWLDGTKHRTKRNERTWLCCAVLYGPVWHIIVWAVYWVYGFVGFIGWNRSATCLLWILAGLMKLTVVYGCAGRHTAQCLYCMGRKYLVVFFLVADGTGTNVWCWYGMVIGFWDNNFYFYGFFLSFLGQIF